LSKLAGYGGRCPRLVFESATLVLDAAAEGRRAALTLCPLAALDLARGLWVGPLTQRVEGSAAFRK